MGVMLAQHPHAIMVKLQSCHSIEDVMVLLQGQAKSFSDFQANDKIMKAIKTMVLTLILLLGTACLADAVGLVHQKGTDGMYSGSKNCPNVWPFWKD
jgi:hypothetical protein